MSFVEKCLIVKRFWPYADPFVLQLYNFDKQLWACGCRGFLTTDCCCILRGSGNTPTDRAVQYLGFTCNLPQQALPPSSSLTALRVVINVYCNDIVVGLPAGSLIL